MYTFAIIIIIILFLDFEKLKAENMSHDQIQPTHFVHYLELRRVCGCAFPYETSTTCFLLLLVVLSAYSESPQQGEPPDPLDLTVVAVCPNSSSDSLGVLAPVLSQNEMSGSVLFQNRVLPWNEVYRNIVLPQSEMFGSQNEVYRTIVLPQSEVFGSQNMILLRMRF